MKDSLDALILNIPPRRLFLFVIALSLWSKVIIAQGEGENRGTDSQEFQKTVDSEELYEQFYEWSVWSPCSRTCGIGIKFRGQVCLRENKALCEKTSRIYQTCNTQACPEGSENFRDVQCASYNGRDIFINGERAKWMSYSRGGNQCLLFCYPYGEELFYYFGKARDGTQCSKEPYGVCVRGKCKSVGCDNKLESGVHMDRCRVCGGNSTTCQPIRGRVQRSPSQFERLTGYADLMVIPKGSTSILLTDNTWNYLALKRRNGDYVVNGNRIVNWSGKFKVGDVEVEYKRLSNNIRETIQITGPTKGDISVMSLLMAGKVNISFEYWKQVEVVKDAGDQPQVENDSHLTWHMGWGSWTACSVSCGGGIKVRSRYRAIKAFALFRGKETDVQRCNTEPCHMMNAGWSEWGPWGDCSTTCGGGARIRFRYCKKPSISARSGCPGRRYAVEQCNVEECPKEETRSVTSQIQGRDTVAPSPAFRTDDYSGRVIAITTSDGSRITKTTSESSRISQPTATRLAPSSQNYVYRDTSTKKTLQDRKQTVLSRAEEMHSLSSVLNALPLSRSTHLASSMKQPVTAYSIVVSTRRFKEASTLSSKLQSLTVKSFDYKHTISEPSVKETPTLSASPPRQSKVTRAGRFLYSSSTELPDVGRGSGIVSMNTSVTAIYATVRPSIDFLATTRPFKLPTTSIESTTILDSGVGFRSDVVAVQTVSYYGYGKSSSGIDSKYILPSFSKETISQSASVQGRPKVVSNSRMSMFGGQPSLKYSVAVTEVKSRDRQLPSTTNVSVTLSLAGQLHSEKSLLTTSASQHYSSRLRKTLNTSIKPSVPFPMKLFYTRYNITNVFPTPVLTDQKSTVVQRSLPSTVNQTERSILESKKTPQSLKPVISSESLSASVSKIVSDYNTLGIRTRHKPSIVFASTSVRETSVQRTILRISISTNRSSPLLAPENTTPVKPTPTLRPWNQTVIRTLEQHLFPSFGSKSSWKQIMAESRSPILEKEGESSSVVSSAISSHHFKTPDVIFITKSMETGKRIRSEKGITVSKARDGVLFSMLKSSKHVGITVIEPVPKKNTEASSQGLKTKTSSTENISATPVFVSFEITDAPGRGFSSSGNASSVKPIRFESIKTTIQRLSANGTLKKSQEIRPESASISSTLFRMLPPWQTLPDYLFSSRSSRPHDLSSVFQKSKLLSTPTVAETLATLPSFKISKLSNVTQSGPVFNFTRSVSRQLRSSLKDDGGMFFFTNALSRPQVQSSLSTAKTLNYRSSVFVSSVYKTPTATSANYSYFTSSSPSSYSKFSQESRNKARIYKTPTATSEKYAYFTSSSPSSYSKFSQSQEIRPESASVSSTLFRMLPPWQTLTDYLFSSRSSRQHEQSSVIVLQKSKLLSTPTVLETVATSPSFNISKLSNVTESGSLINFPTSTSQQLRSSLKDDGSMSFFTNASSRPQVQYSLSTANIVNYKSSLSVPSIYKTPTVTREDYAYFTSSPSSSSYSKFSSSLKRNSMTPSKQRLHPIMLTAESSKLSTTTSAANLSRLLSVASKSSLISEDDYHFLTVAPSLPPGGFEPKRQTGTSHMHPVTGSSAQTIPLSTPTSSTSPLPSTSSAATIQWTSLSLASTFMHFMSNRDGHLRLPSAGKNITSYFHSLTASLSRQHNMSSVSKFVVSKLQITPSSGEIYPSLPLARSFKSSIETQVRHRLITSSPSPQFNSTMKLITRANVTEYLTGSPSRKQLASTKSSRLSSTIKIEAMTSVLDSSKKLPFRQILHSSMSTQLTPSLRSSVPQQGVLSLQSRHVRSAIQGEGTITIMDSLSQKHMRSSLAPQYSLAQKVEAMASFTKFSPLKYKVRTLSSSRFSSPIKAEATSSHLDSLASHFSKQQVPLPISLKLSSTTNVEEKTSTMDFIRSSSAKHGVLPSTHVRFTSMLKGHATTILMHSSKTLLLQPMLLSMSRKSSPSLKGKHSTSDIYYTSHLLTTPTVQLFSSCRFTSGRQEEGTLSVMDSLSISPSSKRLPSSISLSFSSEHKKVIATFRYSSTTLSSQDDVPSLIYPQVSPLEKEHSSTTHIYPRTSTISTIVPSVITITRIGATTSNNDSLRYASSLGSKVVSSVSPEMQSSSALKEGASGSFSSSLRMFSPMHQMFSSPPKELKTISVVKADVTPSFNYSLITSFLRYEVLSSPPFPISVTEDAKPTISFAHSSKSPSSKQPMVTSVSSYFSYLPKPLCRSSKQSNSTLQTGSGMSSLTASPSTPRTLSVMSLNVSSAVNQEATARTFPVHKMLPLPSTQFSPTQRPKVQAYMTHLVQSLRSSPSTKLITSSSPQLSITAMINPINYLRSSLSRRQMLRPLYSYPSSAIEVNLTKSLVDRLKTSQSKHGQPSMSIQLNSTAKAETVPRVMNSLRIFSMKHQMSSLLSPQSTLEPKVQITKGYMDSSSRYEVSSFLSSQTTSVLEVEYTTNLVERPLMRFPSHFPSSMNGQSTKSLLDSSAIQSSRQHIMSSTFPQPSSTLQLEPEATIIGSLKISSSMEEIVLPVTTLFNSTQIGTTRLKENIARFSSSQHLLSSVSGQLRSSLKPSTTTNVNVVHTITSSPSRRRTIPLSQQLSSTLKGQDVTSPVDSLMSSSRQRILTPTTPALTEKITKRVVDSLKPFSKKQTMPSLSSTVVISAPELETITSLIDSFKVSSIQYEMPSLPSPLRRSAPKVETTPTLRDSYKLLSTKHGMPSLPSPQRSSKLIGEITESARDSLRPSSMGDGIPLFLTSSITSTPSVQSTMNPLVSFTSSSSSQRVRISISSHFTSAVRLEPMGSLMGLTTFPSRRIVATSVISQFNSSQRASSKLKDFSTGLSSSELVLLSMSRQFSSSRKAEAITSLTDSLTAVSWKQHITSILSSSSIARELLGRSTVTEFTSEEQPPSSMPKHYFLLTSFSSDQRHQTTTASLKVGTSEMVSASASTVETVSVTDQTATQERKPTYCPPCDLSQRLNEKYCYSDYALLVRIRSDAVVNGNKTSHATKVRKIFKTNKPMKKKLEIRFTNGDCNCRTDLLMKRDYFVFGKHAPWNGTITFLEVNRDSFVTEWDGALEEEIKQLEERCSRHSIIPTPRISPTATLITGASLHLIKKEATTVLLSTRSSDQMETPASRDLTDAPTSEPSATTSTVEGKCGPCENRIKRTMAYCTSDFVMHLWILTEAINEFSHDTSYRVQSIDTFKLTRGLTTIRTVWILNNICRCPLLIPGKQYLVMGSLKMRAGSTEPIAEISRKSYVVEWRGSMKRRLPDLKKRCPPDTTEMSTVLTETAGSMTTTIPSTTGATTTEENTSPPLTTLPTTKQPVACRVCRISRKRNRNYCESDFVIRARVLTVSYNEVLQERKYRVKIIEEFKREVELKERHDIFVLNDNCHCPKLELREHYVIMGKVQQVSDTNVRLLIPPRPFVWKWRTRMGAALKSISDVCDN